MNWLGVLGGIAVLGLVVIPLVAPTAGQWSGADREGIAAVSDANPSYEPWFEPIWTPPSAEIETVLFTLQAAVGGTIIGYYVGSTTDT